MSDKFREDKNNHTNNYRILDEEESIKDDFVEEKLQNEYHSNNQENDDEIIQTNELNDLKSNVGRKKLRKLEDDEEELDIMNDSVKKFRFIIGLITIVTMFFSFVIIGAPSINYQSDLASGLIDGIQVGDRLSQEAVTLQPTDIEVDLTGRDGGPIKLYIWDFDDEDGDYVQVFVNGSPHTEPFMIRHKEVKVGVPGEGLIQVKGIRDGDGKGISYGVFFNKTGEEYLNTAPINGTNTYTLKTAY